MTLLAGASSAHAGADEDRRAEALFREGREAVDRGDFTTGCARFTAALALTRRAGPLLNLASCEEHLDHLVAARDHWKEGIALLPAADERLDLSQSRLRALEARLPRLTIALVPGAPPGSTVTLDGAPIAAAALGQPQPVDPGEHVVVAAAPDHAEQRSTVKIGESERRELAVAPAAAAGTEAPPPSSGLRTAGFVLGGLGVASLAAGAIAGGMVISKKSTMDANCTPACNDAARSAASSGRTLAILSDVTFAGGAALAAAGVTLALVSPKPRSPSPSSAIARAPLPGGGALLLRGTF